MPERQQGADTPILLRPIGVIRTPYTDWAPYQPVEREEGVGKFHVQVHERYAQGLQDLDRFAYVILVYYLDRIEKEPGLLVRPPWVDREVGLFASRSPNRPNPIGLSIVRVHAIEGREIHTWPIDVFDGTPLLDIKPYIATLDSKTDADDGWIEGVAGKEHLLQHVRGIPHGHHHE
ncbi:MAG: tRNA (N6-threonylcarbamoyladenosine(37)-N6)-methyltransferase TrmO [Deltaproteobacteria bacterium]|nr:tRNA (N6-threonylcarbamoyladenosine(37)-N6)-methyltransferase TrmO [Deltaproteobacteria bacterium]